MATFYPFGQRVSIAFDTKGSLAEQAQGWRDITTVARECFFTIEWTDVDTSFNAHDFFYNAGAAVGVNNRVQVGNGGGGSVVSGEDTGKGFVSYVPAGKTIRMTNPLHPSTSNPAGGTIHIFYIGNK